MKDERPKVTVDADGVRTTEDPRVRLLVRLFVGAIALVIGATAVGIVMMRRQPHGAVAEITPDPTTGRAPAARPPSSPSTDAVSSYPRRGLRAVHRSQLASQSGADAGSGERAASAPAGRADERADDDDAAAAEPELDARDVIEALREAGVTEGIAVFPPPGTDPIKPGIVVPEDYEVPEGYVRHHQVTDDGRPLPPILMFSPDYEFLDPSGKPIALPPDGIVPPEMAPPDLPIRILEVPKRKRGS